ncbi:hypothetical protein [Haliangium sp.]|uniref:hypothetical protein n=1 Tax=Haliangium sp. TaxID=2663208 RepID=UPI003D13C7E0
MNDSNHDASTSPEQTSEPGAARKAGGFPRVGIQIDGGGGHDEFQGFSLRYADGDETETLARVFVTTASPSLMHDSFAGKDLTLPEYTEHWLINRPCMDRLFNADEARGQLVIEKLGEFEGGATLHNDVHADEGEIRHYQCTQVAAWAEVEHDQDWDREERSLLFWLPEEIRADVLGSNGESCPTALRLDARKDADGHYRLVATTWYSTADVYLFHGWKPQQNISLTLRPLSECSPRRAGNFAARTTIQPV